MSENILEIEAPSLSVASWRRMTPLHLRNLRHDYRAFLLSITFLPDRPEVMTKGAADAPVASMMVAAAVRDGIEDDEADLVWAWISLAAVSSQWGDDVAEVAGMAVAARLVTLSTEAMAEDRRHGLRLRGLALRWANRVADQVGTSNVVEHLFGASKSAHVSIQALIESLQPAKQDPEQSSSNAADVVRAKLALGSAKAAEAKRPVPDGKPTLTVVKEIALGRGGSEDKALVTAWAPLTEPMPLAGGVDPSVLGAALEAEFPWMVEAIEAIVGDLPAPSPSRGGPRPFPSPGAGGTAGQRQNSPRPPRRVPVGTGFGEVTAAGSSDNRLLQGTARGWSTASPSYVLHIMRSAKAANPVILVDELDKTKPDECLMAQADLSQVNWVVCVNDPTPLRGPLLTRLRVVPTPMPGPEHCETVLASIARDLAEELGVPPVLMPELPAEAKAALKDAFRKGFSVRRIRAAYEGAIRAGGMVRTARMVN